MGEHITSPLGEKCDWAPLRKPLRSWIKVRPSSNGNHQVINEASTDSALDDVRKTARSREVETNCGLISKKERAAPTTAALTKRGGGES